MSISKAKLIYNPNAGKKRSWVSVAPGVTLEEIKALFEQYQISVDFAPTQGPDHATELAQEAVKKGYKTVIAAGGDGTISEVANALVGSDACLGILPVGSFMNIARMLSIPTDLEGAVHIIKIGRTRKIDVGKITFLDETPHQSAYYLENAGFGIEAEFHQRVLEFERGNYQSLFAMLKLISGYYKDIAQLTLDGKEIRTRATMITISNGPITGAALHIAPVAKLNDHRLTVSLYKMTKWQILQYFLRNSGLTTKRTRKIEVHQAKVVRVESRVQKLVHADARVYGMTPVEFEIVPGALNVIAGFPKPGQSALLKRTLLDP